MATYPLVVSSLNAFYKNTAAEIDADIDKVRAAGASVIGLQEMGAAADRKALDRMPRPWRHYSSGKVDSVPIAWDSRVLARKSVDAVFLSPQTHVGEDGGTPTPTLQEKWAAVVRFEHLPSGKPLSFINVHLVPSAVGSDGEPISSREERVKVLKQQVDNVAALLTRERRKSKGNVILVGDMNVNYKKDRQRQHPELPYAEWGKGKQCWPTFRTIGLTQQGTKGDRLIDWICCISNSDLRPKAHRILFVNSDHNAIVATFAVTGPGTNNPPPPEDPGAEEPEDPTGPETPEPGIPLPHTPPYNYQPSPGEVKFDDQCGPA